MLQPTDMHVADHRCRECGSVYPLVAGCSAKASHGPDGSCTARDWEQVGEWEPLTEYIVNMPDA